MHPLAVVPPRTPDRGIPIGEAIPPNPNGRGLWGFEDPTASLAL